MSVVLYVRIPEEVDTRLRELVEQTGLTLATVATEVLSRGLGVKWPSSVGRLHQLLDGARGEPES